ncbi:MAG: hypothetical protein EXR71_08280 [Myxococcales bacterium]|nr:hypothetical protein [Myxococcales bacterium]
MGKARRGQSAVETMMVVPLVAMGIMSLYYLWSIIFASENAHIRAREYVLHGDHFLSDADGVSGSDPFSGTNYERADSQSFRFEARATDQSLPVFGRTESIRTTAVITSD